MDEKQRNFLRKQFLGYFWLYWQQARMCVRNDDLNENFIRHRRKTRVSSSYRNLLKTFESLPKPNWKISEAEVE